MPRKVRPSALTPQRSPLFAETFPDLAKQISLDLRKLKRRDPADQIKSLEIVHRCRCGQEDCGTLQTIAATERRKFRGHRNTMFLSPVLGLTEAEGHILDIETMDAEVEFDLRELFS